MHAFHWLRNFLSKVKECSDKRSAYLAKEFHVNEFPLLVKECYETANIFIKERADNSRYEGERSKAIMPASSPPFRWEKKNKKKGNNRLFISPKK